MTGPMVKWLWCSRSSKICSSFDSLQFRKLWKFFILLSGQIPLPECKPAPCSLAFTHSLSESAPTQAPALLEECLPAWPDRLLPCSGASLRIRKVQNLFSAFACEEVYQQARCGNNPVKHYCVCWDRAMFHEISAKGSPHTFWKSDGWVIIWWYVFRRTCLWKMWFGLCCWEKWGPKIILSVYS